MDVGGAGNIARHGHHLGARLARHGEALVGGRVAQDVGQDERAVPAVDVYEEKDAIVVKAEVPGMTKDDLQVSMSGDVITIRGEKKRQEDVRDGEYYRHERSYGAFTRSVRLPTDVQTDKATATFKNGVLTIQLFKVPVGNGGTIPITTEK